VSAIVDRAGASDTRESSAALIILGSAICGGAERTRGRDSAVSGARSMCIGLVLHRYRPGVGELKPLRSDANNRSRRSYDVSGC